MVIVHHLADVIIQVELGAAIDDGVDFVEQFIEGQAFGLCDFFQVNLSVDSENNAHLVGTLVDEGTNAEVLEAVYLVLLAVAGYELAELGSIAVGLAFAHALDVLQLFDSRWI